MSKPPGVSETAGTRQPEQRIARLEHRLARERRARRQAEEIADRGMRELWLINQSLDARVDERTADLEETLAMLKVASTSRERFLATLSHEMRTPLNGILGMLELLAPYVDGEQPHTYLKTARQSADRLHQLLARLLDLVDLDTGRLVPELRILAAADLAESIRDRWQRPAMRGGQLLTVTSFLDDRLIEIDDGRVLQIVDELLDNTLAHASSGAVRVEIRLDHDLLELTVRDSGPGIDPARIEELFSDFSMLDDSTARASRGLGLGLGLCRRIATALGGTLEVSSDGQTYSCATLRVAARVSDEELVKHGVPSFDPPEKEVSL